MIRVLFIVLIVFVIAYIFISLRLKKSYHKMNEAKPCRICGSYVLKNDAVCKGEKIYCSVECLQQDKS